MAAGCGRYTMHNLNLTPIAPLAIPSADSLILFISGRRWEWGLSLVIAECAL
jgi:hypothetical protein